MSQTRISLVERRANMADAASQWIAAATVVICCARAKSRMLEFDLQQEWKGALSRPTRPSKHDRA
jgi:hypothetical protein